MLSVSSMARQLGVAIFKEEERINYDASDYRMLYEKFDKDQMTGCLRAMRIRCQIFLVAKSVTKNALHLEVDPFRSNRHLRGKSSLEA